MRMLLAQFATASLFFGGCSIPPDISDVSPLDTTAVVRHVECETRIAILQNIASYIQTNAASRASRKGGGLFGSGDFMEIMARLRRLSLGDLYNVSRDDPDLANYIFAWDTVVIGFAFTFDISEENNNSGGLEFAFPAGIHTVKLDASSKLNTGRRNIKRFTVIASVANLLQSRACLSPEMVALNRGVAEVSYSPIGPRGTPDDETIKNVVRTQLPNPVLPITGSIGMAEVLESFAGVWRYNQGGQSRTTALQHRKSVPTYGLLPGGLSADMKAEGGYVQTLTFTTIVNGKIAPTIEVSGSNLKKAMLVSDNTRTDKHELMIVIIAPTEQEIFLSETRSRKDREKNEREIAEIVAGISRRAVAAERAASPSINATINYQQQLNALQDFSRSRLD